MHPAPGDRVPSSAHRPHRFLRQAAVLRRRAARLDPTVHGLLWAILAGICFVLLNAAVRGLSVQLDSFQAQFMRYLMGVVVMLPVVLRVGLAALKPQSVRGQFVRGLVHTSGLALWFMAIPYVTLADVTALSFVTPIFVMLGAALFLGEKMRAARWVASAIGMCGVLVVVGPQLSGEGGLWLLVLLASSPLFAASFLINKSQTRVEHPQVIVVWQAITVAALSLPMALWNWRSPSLAQWGLALLGGLIGSAGHYALTRSFKATDISATQTVKFLELVWASLLGWMIFGNVPSRWTVIGGVVICASTVWIARREAMRRG